MDRIWLKSYPKGVPAEIDVNTYASLRDVFDSVVAEFGPRPAYTCMGKSITFADLDRASAAFGAFLQGRGLKKGARVALDLASFASIRAFAAEVAYYRPNALHGALTPPKFPASARHKLGSGSL